jgi:hypothetical protein
MGLPYDPTSQRLFGVPVVTTNAQTAGVVHVLTTGAVALDTDSRGVDVQWSENATADSFGKNLVFADVLLRHPPTPTARRPQPASFRRPSGGRGP